MKKFACDRINQLEAIKIDDECKDTLKTALIKAFEFFPQNKVNQYSPEIKLILDFIYFRFTIAQNNPMPGNLLQNIDFLEKSTQSSELSTKLKLLYFLLSVIGSYARNKIQNKLLFFNNINGDQNQLQLQSKYKKMFFIAFESLDKLIKVLNFLNFIDFILHGEYRSLLQRILGLKMKLVQPNTARYLDFELLNRTIIWNLISDAISFFLPFLKNIILSSTVKNLFLFTTFLGSINMDQSEDFALQKCGICGEGDMTLPKKVNGCNHFFCYYCISNFVEGQQNKEALKCPRCQQAFTQIVDIENKEQ